MSSRRQDSGKAGLSRVRTVAFLATAFFIGGVALAWTASRFAWPISPGLILGTSITVSVMLLCCSSYILTRSYANNMPVYEEMEIEFKKGMQFFENREWQQALEVFRELMGPSMNHKRALYYAARCCEELSDWEGVKLHSRNYLDMKSKDKEVWEMLARAHKRLFEYEEAEDAMDRASRI